MEMETQVTVVVVEDKLAEDFQEQENEEAGVVTEVTEELKAALVEQEASWVEDWAKAVIMAMECQVMVVVAADKMAEIGLMVETMGKVENLVAEVLEEAKVVTEVMEEQKEVMMVTGVK